MVDSTSMTISRQWFIQAKKDRIEDVYSFKSDKDVLFFFNRSFVLTDHRFWAQEAMVPFSKPLIKSPRQREP